MYQKVTTFTEFVLAEEKKFPQAKGNFTILMAHIENAAKIIASHVKKTGLVDIIGYTGDTNTYGDEVKKIDEFANQLMTDMLLGSGEVFAVGSEELPDFVYSEGKTGEYIVLFDPLDGSSNIDVNINLGTIFSIYHKGDGMFKKGTEQVAAGYFLYGPSVMCVYSAGDGVNGFTLDPSIGSFLLSHPDIKIPESGSIYAINEGNSELYSEGVKKYLDSIKKLDKPYSNRYVAAMVADVHRILLKGGIFIYPANKKAPDGKLRLLFEVNPLSYIVMQAGGKAVSSKSNPLDILPTTVSQKVPIVMGSKNEVEKYEQFT